MLPVLAKNWCEGEEGEEEGEEEEGEEEGEEGEGKDRNFFLKIAFFQQLKKSSTRAKSWLFS